MTKRDESLDERSPERKEDLEAQLDELGSDPGQVGVDSAGQSGDAQGLSSVAEANEESVEELADSEQALEAVRGRGRGRSPPIVRSGPPTLTKSTGRPDDLRAEKAGM